MSLGNPDPHHHSLPRKASLCDFVSLRTCRPEAGLRLRVPADWPGLQEVGGKRAASVIVRAARFA